MSLRRFDYETQMKEALRYRRAEVPFIIRGVSSLGEAVECFRRDRCLLAKMGGADDSVVYPVGA
jgi:hypothetical protein